MIIFLQHYTTFASQVVFRIYYAKCYSHFISNTLTWFRTHLDDFKLDCFKLAKRFKLTFCNCAMPWAHPRLNSWSGHRVGWMPIPSSPSSVPFPSPLIAPPMFHPSSSFLLPCQQSYLLLFGIPSPTHFFHSSFKTFLFYKSFPPLPFFSSFLNIHYMDSPDCLLLFLSTCVFYFLVFLFLHFSVVGSVR